MNRPVRGRRRAARWLVLLGWFQIVGGLLVFAGPVTITRGPSSVWFNTSLLSAALGVLTVAAGVLLLWRPRAGLLPSLVVQCLQVVSFEATARYVFAAGPIVRVHVNSGGAKLAVGGGGQFIATAQPTGLHMQAVGYYSEVGFWLGSQDSVSWTVAVNVVALYFAWQLMQRLRLAGAHTRAVKVEQQEDAMAAQRQAAAARAPRYSEHASRVLEHARDEAGRLHHQFLAPEHLLLAMQREEGSSAVQMLAALGVDVMLLQSQLQEALPASEVTFNPHRRFPPTSRAAQCLQFAAAIAESQRAPDIDVPHILLAILREGHSHAAKLLVSHGVTESAARAALARAASSATTSSAPAPTAPRSPT